MSQFYLKSKAICFSMLICVISYAQPPNVCLPFDLAIPSQLNIINPNATQSQCDHSIFRTFDGTLNNLNNSDLGKANIPFERLLPAYYQEDGSTIIDRGNPRDISNKVMAQTQSIPSQEGLTSLMFSFLQFIDHDITATSEGEEDALPIPVPLGDSYFDPFNTGRAIISFTRSHVGSGTGTDASNPRQQTNTITAWIDGSVIYGSDPARADWLRLHQGGKLQASTSAYGPLLPYNTTDGQYDSPIDPNAPRMGGDRDRQGNPQKVFVSGDIRANEQPGLTALHVLFMKEHNRICDELIANGMTDDEFNYFFARKKVAGLLQSIIYGEMLPALGIQGINTSYDANISPNIFNEFATAAYRLGHTMVTEELALLIDECDGDSFVRMANLPVRDAFFNPTVLQDFGPDAVIRGLFQMRQETFDAKIIDDVRNFLFGPPGAGGFDLASLNIQRGRDHGLPDFNAIRQAIGLTPYTSFNQISNDPATVSGLSQAYSDVNNIDAWVGMLAEKKAAGAVLGETLQAMLKLQFENIIRADRFYYWRDPILTQSDKLDIYMTRLADIIERNSTIENAHSTFYWQGKCLYSNNYCEFPTNSNSDFWVERTLFNKVYTPSGNDDGYGNFTSQVTRFTKSHPNCFLFESAVENTTALKYGKAFIDFNNNGDFEPNEVVMDKTKSQYFQQLVRIPADADTGITRMRLIVSSSPIGDDCGNNPDGEVEDYTVIIEP